MTAQTYVYIDKKPDGTPFYVGIGAEERVKYRIRNKFHTAVCKKHPTWSRHVVEIADRVLCEELEMFLISEIGRRDLGLGTLTNLTDGGEGVVNYKVTAELRAIRSRNATNRYSCPEERKKHSLSQKSWSSTEEARLKNSVAQKLICQNPEIRANRSMAGKMAHINEQGNLNRTVGAKAYFAELRADETRSQVDRLRRSESAIKNMSLIVAGSKKFFSDPDKVKLRSSKTAATKANKSLEEKEITSKRLSDAAKLRWIKLKQGGDL